MYLSEKELLLEEIVKNSLGAQKFLKTIQNKVVQEEFLDGFFCILLMRIESVCYDTPQKPEL